MKWIGSTILLFFLGPLAACADAPTLSLVMDPTPTPAKPANSLNIYSQDEAIDPVTLTNFADQFQVKLRYDTQADNETALADIQAGLADYDLVILSDYSVSRLRAAGIFAPLNHENIPNFNHIDPAFINPVFDPGNRYCVPFQWGNMGLGYNLQASGQEIHSWADFFGVTPPLRLGLPDDSRLSLAAALLYAGYSPNTSDEFELNAATALLENHAAQIVTYAPATGQALLAGGQVEAVFERSGAIFQLMENNPAIRYAIPNEGSVMWIDNLCLLASASQPELAERFINYILDPQVGAIQAKASHYGSPNQAVVALPSAADRDNPVLDPGDDLGQRLFFVVNIDPATSELYNQTWAELAAGFNPLPSN
jgi:spermidine/putrescine transport system substrate-binding protein